MGQFSINIKMNIWNHKVVTFSDRWQLNEGDHSRQVSPDTFLELGLIYSSKELD